VTESSRIVGAARLASTMQRAAAQLDDLKRANERTAQTIAAAARSRAPRGKTGRLVASIRPVPEQRESRVEVPVPYAVPVHAGVPSRNITANPFLARVAYGTRPTWNTFYVDDIGRVIRGVRGA
jgi:hypothetical protein